MTIQTLDRSISAVASVADPATGLGGGMATFMFDYIPLSQIYIGTVNLPSAPDTAVIIGTSGTSVKGQWKGSNDWGPIQLGVGEQLILSVSGLIPGENYAANWSGVVFTEDDGPGPTWPDAYADSVTTGTQQIELGSGPDTLGGTSISLTTSPLWRSVWVLVVNGTTTNPPILQGSTDVFYEATTPPYIAGGGAFFRFPIVTAAESFVTLTFPVVTSSANPTYYWGVDLADTDALAYAQNGSSGTVPNTPDPLRFSYAGALVAGTSAATDIPGGFVSCPAGSTAFLTRLWGNILGGTSVNVTVTVNRAPAYTGPVNVTGLVNITLTTTPSGFVLPTALQVYDLDLVDIVLSTLVGSPTGLSALVDDLIVPG